MAKTIKFSRYEKKAITTELKMIKLMQGCDVVVSRTDLLQFTNHCIYLLHLTSKSGITQDPFVDDCVSKSCCFRSGDEVCRK